jgi:hypothetical protein
VVELVIAFADESQVPLFEYFIRVIQMKNGTVARYVCGFAHGRRPEIFCMMKRASSKTAIRSDSKNQVKLI